MVKNSILMPLYTTGVVISVSPCPQGLAPSSESAGIPLRTFSRGSKSSTSLLLWLSVCWGSFQSERFNQTGEKEDGESSFLSDSALRSAGFFQEKRDFPFSSLQRGVSFVSSSSLVFFRCLSVSHLLMFILFSPPSCHYPPLFSFLFCSLWVWLKVTLHTGFHSGERGAEKKKAQRGKQWE